MKKLTFTFPEIQEDFNKAWRKIGLLSARRSQKNPPTQLELWQEFIKENLKVHRPLVQVVKLMLSVFSNTSDIERSYSFLEMICEQHRKRMLNSTMNTLYMLKNIIT